MAHKHAVILVLFLALNVYAQDKNVVFFNADSNSFSATGKWADEKPVPHADDIPQEVEIDCFRSWNTCIESIAELYMGHPHITVFYRDIIQWDDNGITTDDSSGICMTNKMIINFSDRSIIAVSSPKILPEDKKKACKFFGAYTASKSIFVAKGTLRWEREHWPGLSDRK